MKKTLACFVALVLVSTFAFAKGSTDNATTTSSSGGKQTASDANLNPVGTLPIVKTKETFSMMNDNNNEPDSFGMYKVLEEETNVHVDLRLYPYATAVEQKQIQFNLGTYADVVSGWILSDNDILQLSAQGVLIPLEDLIATQTINIKEALAITGVRQSMTLPDGHIYSPPYVVGEPEVTFGMFINKVWLQQVGLEVPTTPAEFKAALIAFRDKIKTTSDGQKIIPFSADPVNMDLGNYAGWWGQPASNVGVNAGYVALINGKVEFTATRNEYKEMIKFFADLWKEGLVDQELFTQDQTTWKAKGKMNLYGVNIAYGVGDFWTEPTGTTPEDRAVENWRDYVALPALKAGSATPLMHRNSFGVTLFRTQFAITDNAKNPITIIRWLDRVFDSVRSLETDAGPEGISWEWVEKGKTWRGIDLEALGWTEKQREPYGWGNYWTTSMPKYRRGLEELPPAGQPKAFDELKYRDALLGPYLEKETLPQVWLDQTQARRIADLQTAIVDYVKQKQAEWIGGQSNIDAEWDAYVAQLDKLGLQEFLTLKRNAVSATK